MREQVINSVLENKIIVILRGFARETLIPLAEAMYEGGIRLIEITFSADGKISDEAVADDIKLLAEHFEGRMHIGAGTVLKESQVELVKAVGGKFIISPDMNEAIIRKTRELGLVSMPGALTPTEVQTAHLAGADFVKLFPVSTFGAEYVKAIKAPLSHIKLLAVGGVKLEDMKTYLDAGACGFGIGTTIANKSFVERGEYEKITELAKKYLDAIS